MRRRSGPALCAGSPAVALVGECGPQRQVFVAGVKTSQIDELIGRSRIQRQAGCPHRSIMGRNRPCQWLVERSTAC
jgi:hypothetical protein